MSRGPCTFKQRDLTAAVKAVIAAGCEVARAEVDKEGRIIVITGKPADASSNNEAGEWDDLEP